MSQRQPLRGHGTRPTLYSVLRRIHLGAWR
ncbi:hypothetical protein CBM2592_A160301 [Cupriavidus taiwanensis]|nr:hypothetical protein CBM2592_A160301 [Cupriavidus taiwanensis]SPA12494.1 hypothetical protein CBM2631_A170299 [Cupriavidus taiwanensis]SPD43667.1 protein of unknown function [Cupriavidus taiwanensis]